MNLMDLKEIDSNGNIYCRFSELILSEDILGKYVPFLKENLPDAEVTFKDESEPSDEQRKPRVNGLIIFVDKDLSHLPIEFKKELYVGQDKETDEDVWGVREYVLSTMPGCEPHEIAQQDLDLIDKVRKVTDNFSP
jgi:hypothetical protein